MSSETFTTLDGWGGGRSMIQSILSLNDRKVTVVTINVRPRVSKNQTLVEDI